MASTGGGRKGWPLPPPPLKEGVDRRAFRQAKDWTLRHQQKLVEEQCSYQIYHQDQGLRSSVLQQRCQNYSEELKTVIRTSPLKWNVLPRSIDNVQLLSNVVEECEEEKKEGLERELDGDDRVFPTQNLSISKTNVSYHSTKCDRKNPNHTETKEEHSFDTPGSVVQQSSPDPKVIISLTGNEEILNVEVAEDASIERSDAWFWCCKAYVAAPGDNVCPLAKHAVVDDVDVEGK